MDDNDKIFEQLILEGALEVNGIDSETGEFLYNFTPKLKEIYPALYNEHLNNINGEVMYFWERGFLLMNDITAENPIIRLSPKAFDQDEVDLLPPDKRFALMEIKRILKVV